MTTVVVSTALAVFYGRLIPPRLAHSASIVRALATSDLALVILGRGIHLGRASPQFAAANRLGELWTSWCMSRCHAHDRLWIGFGRRDCMIGTSAAV